MPDQQQQSSILNLLMEEAPNIDFYIDEEATKPDYTNPSDLIIAGFDISRLLSVVAFALDYNNGGKDRTFFEEAGLLPRSEIVKKVGAVVSFEVKNKEGKVQIWTADMKKTGRIYKGKVPSLKPDVSVICSDKDLVALAKGEQSPQKAFLTGRLRVRGKLMVGLRMNDLLNAEIGKMSKL